MDDSLQKVLLPLEGANTPPGWVYWEPEVFLKEQKKIFAASWLCVGHGSRLKEPGDFFVVEWGQQSVIVCKDPADTLQAYHNVCRHRGTRIVQTAAGNTTRFLCPYHAWVYDLNGQLRGAPGMDEQPGFQKSNYPLRSVRVTQWNGLLFICLDASAPDLRSSLSDFPDLSYLNLDQLRQVGRHDYQVQSNWKLVSENYNECYHCPVAHPQLHRVSADRNFPDYGHRGRLFTGGPMSVRETFNTLTNSGKTSRQALPGWRAEDQGMVFYFCIYPNLFLSIAPDYVMTHYLFPLSPDKVFITTEWFCAEQQMQQTDFDPTDIVEFWDTTNRQDWTLCETALNGLKSSGHVPGPYHPWESAVHDFDRWYVTAVFGE